MPPLTPKRIQLPQGKPLREIVQTREDDAIIKEQRQNPQNHDAQLQIQKIIEKHQEQKVEDKHLSVQDLLTEEEIAAVQEFFKKNTDRFKLPKETSFRIQLPNQEPKEFKFNYTIIQDYNGFLYLVSRGKRKTSDPSDLFYGLLSDEDSPTKVKKIIPINGGEFSAMKVERTDVKVTYKNQLLFEQEKQTIIEQKSKDITPATELIKVEHNTSQLQDEVTFIQKHFPDRPIRHLKTVTRGQLKNRMLCQEYTGKEVNELLQETTSTTEQLKIILAVLMALKEKFHDRDLVHGDFKPPNVIVENMIDGTYRVHIIDFGLSGKVKETPKYYNLSDYATPDQCCGAPFNPATDIYNFGEYIKLHLIGGISKTLPSKPDRPTTFNKNPNCRLSPKVQELIQFIAPTQELFSGENPKIPTVDECIRKTSKLLRNQQEKDRKQEENVVVQDLLSNLMPSGEASAPQLPTNLEQTLKPTIPQRRPRIFTTDDQGAINIHPAIINLQDTPKADHKDPSKKPPRHSK